MPIRNFNFLLTSLISICIIVLHACNKKDCPTPSQITDTLKTNVTQTKQFTIVTTKNDTIKTTKNDTTYIITVKHDTLNTFTRLITLRQSASNDGDAYIHELIPTGNASASLYNLACNWTRFGNPATYRFLIKFDMSLVKATDNILSAKLYLTSRTMGATDEQTPDMTKTLNNDFQICLAKGPWTATTVSWNTQPVFSTTTGENLNFPGSTLSNTLLVFDITTLVKKIVGKEQTFINNGFVFKLRYEHDTYTVLSPYEYEAIAFHSMNSTTFQYLPYMELLLESH